MGASGVSLRGTSGLSEASSLGDASLGGMHHANTARIMQSAAAFRRAAASRQSTKSSGEEGTAGEGGLGSVPAAQRTQDTNLSRVVLTNSSQATQDGATTDRPGSGGSVGTAGGGGGGGHGGKAAAHGLQRPQKHPMRHPVRFYSIPIANTYTFVRWEVAQLMI